jgi:alkaline phosphatase D
VLSVPIIHLPKLAAKIAARVTPSGEDFSDRWSSGGHIRDRDRVLKILHEHQTQHPFQQVVLLSGDIHIGCVHKIL